MPAKRKIAINRKKKDLKVKEVILEESIEEIWKEEEVKLEEKEAETPVSTVVEEEINIEEVAKPRKSRKVWQIVWNWTRTAYVPPKWRIKFEAQVAPVPMFLLPKHIQRYLMSKWLGTNVRKKDKEYLQKKWVDMKIIEELKQFLSSRS